MPDDGGQLRTAPELASTETPTETAFEIWSWDDRSVTRPLDRDRSLEELERDCWPAPSPNATRLITTAHALRRRPVGELTVEDMRLLIGQDIGLPYLLPPRRRSVPGPSLPTRPGSRWRRTP
ncbi:contact-dependent growth inhibition system immunity protein [Actinacidiphila glaucinigra]|uniref:contact-dependent growth inhibition system immunity protein n=1 Tax=Actinacidiphila glaucinigra TaxID=235986 RepID=UPI003869D1FF